VVVTTTESGALCPLPPAIVRTQVPAATGVTVNCDELFWATVTMPLHEFGCPRDGVVDVNDPE
jgi:hypothetical protein